MLLITVTDNKMSQTNKSTRRHNLRWRNYLFQLAGVQKKSGNIIRFVFLISVEWNWRSEGNRFFYHKSSAISKWKKNREDVEPNDFTTVKKSFTKTDF